MTQKIQDVHKDGKIYTVQLIKAFDAKNDPFSAFIIFEQDDFNRLSSEALSDLRNYKDNIIYMKKGHDVTKKEEMDVIDFVNTYYLKSENDLVGDCRHTEEISKNQDNE